MTVNKENFITQLKQKNELALEYIISEYGWIIKSIVRKHLYNLQSHHDECINDILLGIWNNIYSFDESKNTFKNWVAAISKYKTIDYRRRYLKDLNNQCIDNITIVDRKKPLNKIINYEIDPLLEDLLKCLNKSDRDLFLSIYLREETVDDVSKNTGLKKSVIYNRLSRGRQKIRLLSKFNAR